MVSKKVEILGANVDDVEFSLLNKEFQVGIFRSLANEEGLLLYINKVLIGKLQYSTTSEFLYKKLIDLYYNPSDWLKQLECIQKEGSCLFRNVVLKSASGEPVYLDIYLTFMPPHAYGIVHDIKKTDIQAKIETALTPPVSDEIIVVDLDNPQKLILKTKKDMETINDVNVTDEEKAALLNIQNITEDNIEDIEESKEYGEDFIFNNKTFNDAPFGMIIQKENTREIFFNKKIKEIFDIKENTIGYYSLFVNYILPAIESCKNHSTEKEDALETIINTLTSKEAFSLEIQLKNKQLYEYRIYPIIVKVNGQQILYGRVLYLFEATKENEDIEYLKTLSFQDSLTGVDNRRSFDNILEKSIEGAKRYKKPLSLIMFDIDNFKQVNDNYGHQKGDDILKELSALVKVNIRKSDVFARYGGEEFVILCQETKIPQAMYLAEKIRYLIQNNKFSVNKTITCSFGITQYRESEDSRDFIARVDKLLYKAKRNGKNRVEIDMDHDYIQSDNTLKSI